MTTSVVESTVDILVSFLEYENFNRTKHLISHFPDLLREFCGKRELSWHIVVRNNSTPHAEMNAFMEVTKQKYKGNFTFVDSHDNFGFGIGHNLNFKMIKSRVFLALNNDMAFPKLDFIDAVFDEFTDFSVAIIGDSSGHNILESLFGFGRKDLFLDKRDYVDGALLFVKSDVFEKLGGFRSEFKPAYFEDADLCLRARANGYKLCAVPMPHEHWRSSSTANFPPSFYSAIFEHSRSFFLSRWQNYIETGNVSREVLIKFDHDGIGDLIMAVYPLREFVKRETYYGFDVTIALRWTELAFLFKDLPCKVVDIRKSITNSRNIVLRPDRVKSRISSLLNRPFC